MLDRVAGEEDRGARNTRRRMLLEIRDHLDKRHLEPARLVEQDASAAPPRQHHDHQEDAEKHRQPAALDDLQEVRREEGAVDDEERHHERRRAQRLHFQTRQTTMKRSIAVTTMVPVTAMP